MREKQVTKLRGRKKQKKKRMREKHVKMRNVKMDVEYTEIAR